MTFRVRIFFRWGRDAEDSLFKNLPLPGKIQDVKKKFFALLKSDKTVCRDQELFFWAICCFPLPLSIYPDFYRHQTLLLLGKSDEYGVVLRHNDRCEKGYTKWDVLPSKYGTCWSVYIHLKAPPRPPSLSTQIKCSGSHTYKSSVLQGHTIIPETWVYTWQSRPRLKL